MSNLSELVERARYCRDYGNFDSLHGELLDMVEFLDHEFEAERDRANEHFDARMTMHAALGDAWDDGNAAGLDGWIGPGRGAGEVDDEAVYRRNRFLARYLT